MDTRLSVEIAANTEDCRTEARIFIADNPDYPHPNEPYAIAFETPYGWGSELPSYPDESLPVEALFDALEEAAEFLMAYPNRVGDGAPSGLDSSALAGWLLEKEPADAPAREATQ